MADMDTSDKGKVVGLFDNSLPMVADLAKSGLTTADVRSRPAGPAEKGATNTPIGVDGYVLPYFDITGKAIPYYRVRLFDHEPKYKQLVNTPNHIYFPPRFLSALEDNDYVIITEGEKKAAAAVKMGFPCVALSGVDSWRNRTMVIPKDSQVVQNKRGDYVVRTKGPDAPQAKYDEVATGFKELVDLVIKRKLMVIICYDLDVVTGTQPQVQRAAAVLGYELKFRGIPFRKIRQLELPTGANSSFVKVGLDDFLVHPEYGPEALEEAIRELKAARSAFPKHPNPKEYVNKKLQKTNMSRSEMQALATSILCDIDSKGIRVRCPDDESLYYFDRNTHKLLRVNFRLDESFARTDFGIRLYQDYSLSNNDFRLIQWIAAQYTGEEPIIEAFPERVLKLKGDDLYYQLSDGALAKVNADTIQIADNGYDDILFESRSVVPMDIKKVQVALRRLKGTQLKPWWYDTIKTMRMREVEGDRQRMLLALLYSISPWFYRWRGTQLPVEMTIGEAGAGKSSAYQLRLSILTGDPILRNMPKDMSGWIASVAATGGLHVTDNVHVADKKLGQMLSDEICRIVTEPNPHIEARKLYTDSTLIRVPVRSVFALTGIRQPFTNSDIIQRSIITELYKGTEDVTSDADWVATQIKSRGGREAWVAHQLMFAHEMFKLIRQKWKNNYKAKFRLQNVEQLLCLAAEVYGWSSSWIPDYLVITRDTRTVRTDWALEGLCTFAAVQRRLYGESVIYKKWFARDISAWASATQNYKGCDVLMNPRALANFITDKTNLIATSAGVILGPINNGIHTYKVLWRDPGMELVPVPDVTNPADDVVESYEYDDSKS